jgi:5-methyltetrahydropteroyltriglutamate--homocysteine methyltransferase
VKDFRADHVGSLLRPASLLEKRRKHSKGALSSEELREAEDAAILDVLRKQAAVGLPVCTDGEFRRASFLSGCYEALEGLVEPEHAFEIKWQGAGEAAAIAEPAITAFVAAEKLRPKHRMTGGETEFLRRHCAGRYKVTMAGPTMYLNMFQPGITDRAYIDVDEMLGDLVELYQQEVDAQIEDGVACIQLDSLRYAQAIGGALMSGLDIDQVLTQALNTDNAIFGRAKGKAGRAMHICRGNHRSAWLMSGGYDNIAERLFQEADVDRFMLEFDDDRSGGFEPLRFVPKGKIAVLGLVSTKVPELEDQDELVRRIEEAQRFLPLEQLALSPQCGFASTESGNLLSEDEQWRKLELVVETARRVWG